MINSILIGLIILAIVYYVIHTMNVTICNSEEDCNLYNELDKKSACEPVCKNESKVYKDYKNGNCICDDPISMKHIDENMITSDAKPFIANIELYTNIDEKSTILKSDIPNDVTFNNRDFLQKHEKDRYSSLIFG